MKIGWLRNENGKLHNYNLDNKCSQLFLRLDKKNGDLDKSPYKPIENFLSSLRSMIH